MLLAAVSLWAVFRTVASRAADPSFVGVLALAVDDQAAKQLGLSEEVRGKLRAIVERREKEAVNLALSIRELPPDMRAERLAPFVAESERQGLALLTQDQRSKLNQLQLQKKRMSSLVDPEIALALELTSEQQAAIARLMAERATAITRGGETEQRVAREKYERQLRSVLTDAQKATWDEMAGLGPGPTARQVTAVEPSAPASAAADGMPVETPPAETVPVAKVPAETVPAAKAPAETAPAVTPLEEAAPVAKMPAETVPAAKAPAETMSAVTPPAEAAPVAGAPAEMVPAAKAPAETVPVVMPPAEAAPVAKAPAETVPAAKAPAETAPAVTSPVEAAPVAGAPAEMVPAAKAPAETVPAVTPPAEAAPVATAPAEPAPAVAPSVGTVPAGRPSAKTEPAAAAEVDFAHAVPKDVKLRFNFRYQPWEDVLDWLAGQAGLSLQSDLIPEGTFNYTDPHEYTPTEAIDLINSMLLIKGYTLVRRGRLLTVMSTDDEIHDVFVEFVPVEKLDERGEFDLVKTIFHLATMDPTDAQQEIQQLLGPGSKMVVMPKARQIMVTGPVGKLRMIREVIETAESPAGIKERGVTIIDLKHVSPEEVLVIARPLLGLESNKDVGPDISIAIALTGKRMFVTGSREKIGILQDLVESVDVERDAAAASGALAVEQPQLMSHQIREADPKEVLAVLQTLLAGLPDVRLGLDEKTNKVIALGPPSVHRTITETIKTLEGEVASFEVIQLKRVDPQIAVATLTKFLTAKEGAASGVIVDADPLTMKLYVKAPPRYMDLVRTIIESLEGPSGGEGSGSTMRLIPMTGESAVSAVEMVQRLWREPNQIRMTAPSESGPGNLELREIWPEEPSAAKPPADTPRPKPPASTTRQTGTRPAPPPRAAEPAGDKTTRDQRPARGAADGFIHFARFQLSEGPPESGLPAALQDGVPGVTKPAPSGNPAPASSQVPQDADLPAMAETLQEQTMPPARPRVPGPHTGDDIRIEFTPNGILISSQDTAALDLFEEMLRTVAGPPTNLTNKNYTVYFLKHCKAEVARQLISDILGGSTSDSAGGGSMIGEMAANLMGGGGGILGALLGGAGGGGGGMGGVTTVQGTGPVAIVADTRLNCLIVQALPVDRTLIENLLKVIDREGSITDIETAGKPHVLPVYYLEAQVVADMIKEAFANRMATTGSGPGGNQPNPVELIRALRGGRGGRGDADVKNEEAKMTITVDVRSNSLIITAPEPLFRQVEEFVTLVDQGRPELDEDYAVVPLKGTNPEAVRQAVAAITGASSSATSRTQSSQRQGFQFGAPGMGGQRGGAGSPFGAGGFPGMGGMTSGFGGIGNIGGMRGGMPSGRQPSSLGGQRGGMGGMGGPRGAPGGARGGAGGGRRG